MHTASLLTYLHAIYTCIMQSLLSAPYATTQSVRKIHQSTLRSTHVHPTPPDVCLCDLICTMCRGVQSSIAALLLSRILDCKESIPRDNFLEGCQRGKPVLWLWLMHHLLIGRLAYRPGSMIIYHCIEKSHNRPHLSAFQNA